MASKKTPTWYLPKPEGHAEGNWDVYATTDGKFIVVDLRLRPGDRTVSRHRTLDEAVEKVKQLCKDSGV